MPFPPLREMMTRLIGAPTVSSVSPQFDMPNLALTELLSEWLEDAGFAIEIQAIDSRKANLIAQLGEGEQGLALCGHTDTVPYDESRWSSDPLKLDERAGNLYGLGAADMKGFLALVCEAVRSLQAKDLTRPLLIIATADEESGMAGARALATRGNLPASHAVIGEPTGLRPVHMHKGVLMEAIRLIGRSGHSSNPAYGNNALDGMHELIGELIAYREQLKQQFRDEAFEVPTATMNFGHIAGGDNPNRICGECRLHLDMRLMPGMDVATERAELRKRAEQVALRRGLRSECAALFEGLPPFKTSPQAAVVRSAERLTGEPSHAVAFATEGPYLTKLGCETVILGPGDIAVAHQPDEHIPLDAIPRMLGILRGLIAEFCIRQ